MGIFDSKKKKNEKQAVDETIDQSANEIKNEATDANEAAETNEANGEVKEEVKQETNAEDFLFYIQDFFEEKDGGSVVIGQVLIGEMKEKEYVLYVSQQCKVLGGCSIAMINQGKEQLHIASAAGTSNYGSFYAFYLPELTKEEVVKGNLLVSASMLEGTKIEDLNIDDMITKKLQGPTPKIPNDRKNAILPIILAEEVKIDDLAQLTIQEVLFLLSTLRLNHSKTPMQNFEKKEKALYLTVIDKIKKSEKIYITMDKATGYPFINMGFVDLYSNKEYADEAVKFYAQRYRLLETVEITRGMLNKDMNVYAYFFFIGTERIMVDNGQYRSEVKRNDILPTPDLSNVPKESIPVINPKLHFAMLDFFGELRWRVNYTKRVEVLKEKEDAMITEICKARYLVPMKNSQKAQQDNGKLTANQDIEVMFAKIMNQDKKSYVPVFTDWMEFEKIYKKEEWQGAILSIMDAMSIGKEDSIVINPLGENLVLTENSRDKVKEECKRLNITSSLDA